MKQETGYFTSFDGTKLFYRKWNNGSNFNLLIVHGIGEHSGRYQVFAEELMKRNSISVFAFDLRGHGRSDGPKMYVDSFDEFVNDIYAFRSFLEGENRIQGRFVLLGQSMGGLVATLAALNNQSVWQSLILLSPFFAVYRAHSILNHFAKLLNFIFPKLIWRNPVQPLYLSHDPEEVNLYQKDPLIQRFISGRLAREMFGACTQVYHRSSEVNLPVFILAGDDDRIISVAAIRKFYERIQSVRKRIKFFDHCYHELLHEKERYEAIQIISGYLNDVSMGL